MGLSQRHAASDVLLEVDGVRVRYGTGAIGVEDVSFTVGRGEVVSVLGPNGAGKTTSSRAVAGFMRSEAASVVAGSVTLSGADITNVEPHQAVAHGVGYVPERRKVFANLTVAENLAALQPSKGAKRTAERDVVERIHELFPVLHERARELAGRLSGGQQQMLALARSLLLQPDLLVVDEMTLGLHHSLHPSLFEAVRSIAETGTSVLMFEESADLSLQYSDYIYIIRSGRNADEGAPEKFRDNDLIASGYIDG